MSCFGTRTELTFASQHKGELETRNMKQCWAVMVALVHLRCFFCFHITSSHYCFLFIQLSSSFRLPLNNTEVAEIGQILDTSAKSVAQKYTDHFNIDT